MSSQNETGRCQLQGEDGRTFENRQKDHFSRLLREKWECDVEGHGVCVPTEDGQHFQLSDQNVATWVQVLCAGEASTLQPPESILIASNNGGLWNRTDGGIVLQAVAISPARRRSSVRSSSTTSVSSNASSGVPGIGWLSGRALKWVGQRSIRVLEDVVIMKRANNHIDLLKRWAKYDVRLGPKEKEKLFEMLGNALEMSMPFYPTRINKMAYKIGRQIQRWLQAYPDVPQTEESAEVFAQIQICLLPLLLTRISRFDPLAADLAWELLDTLTRVPLTLQGFDDTSTVICIIARELAYSNYTFQNSWLGVDLLRIVETTLLTRDLSEDELSAMYDMAVRRQEKFRGDGEEFCRPWEVALFAQGAFQDDRLKKVVLGPHGLESLLLALDKMLLESPPTKDVDWEHVALILRALAFLSEQGWVAHAVQPAAVVSLLNVFRQRMPERWLCIPFWAMDTIRNIISHRPLLVRILIERDAAADFVTLTTASPLPAKGTPRLLEEYKREATKRAKELLIYIKNFDERMLDTLFSLEPVSITQSFVNIVGQ